MDKEKKDTNNKKSNHLIKTIKSHVHFPHTLNNDNKDISSTQLKKVQTDDADTFLNRGREFQKKRRNTFSSGLRPKLEYNPYGIYSAPKIFDLESMFSTGKTESETMLPYPTENPNDYLPSFFKETTVDLEEKYCFIERDFVGKGGSATIKKIKLKNDDGNLYALKKFSFFKGELSTKYYRRVANEYTLTHSFKHLHIIRTYELLKLPIHLQRSWGMVMDYYQHDLYQLIKKPTWKNIPLQEKMCFFKQVCFGLKYIHEQDVAHLDIKPDNILVSPNGILKITDFGCSELGHVEHGDFKSDVLLNDKQLGTPPYQPPEVTKFKSTAIEKRTKYFSFKFDYWSLGMLLFVIIMSKTPFLEARESDPNFLQYSKDYIRFIEINPSFLENNPGKFPSRGKFAEGFGSDSNFIRLFWRLCDPNPSTRMTLPQLFHDEYFQKIAMCVDESIYECNFIGHEGAKKMKFEIEYGSHKEIVRTKNRLSPSSNSKSNSPRGYKTLISTSAIPENGKLNISVTKKDKGDEKKNPNANSSFPSVHTELTAGVQKSLQSLQLERGAHEPREYDVNKFAYSDEGILRYKFNEDDYNNKKTGYMIVPLEDIIKSSKCEIVPHLHNMQI